MGKSAILDKIVKDLKKEHGAESIMTLKERMSGLEANLVSTGCLPIDKALGGGIPRGRVIEIFGPESSGKTTLALNIVKQFQKSGDVVAFIDVEHAFDAEYASRMGVVEDDLIVSQPNSGDDALNIAVQLALSGEIGLVVIDSVAALVPKVELDGDVGDSFMGVQARLIAQAIRKLVPALHKNNCSIIFINQIREKIGVVFGSNEVTPGGRSIKFASTIRAEIRKIAAIKQGDKDAGIRSRVRVIKNKISSPFKIAECEILFGEGISEESGIIDEAINNNILEKKGSWISFEGENISQGKENLRVLLKNNQGLKQRLIDATNKTKPSKMSQSEMMEAEVKD